MRTFAVTVAVVPLSDADAPRSILSAAWLPPHRRGAADSVRAAAVRRFAPRASDSRSRSSTADLVNASPSCWCWERSSASRVRISSRRARIAAGSTYIAPAAPVTRGRALAARRGRAHG